MSGIITVNLVWEWVLLEGGESGDEWAFGLPGNDDGYCAWCQIGNCAMSDREREGILGKGAIIPAPPPGATLAVGGTSPLCSANSTCPARPLGQAPVSSCAAFHLFIIAQPFR